MKITCTLLFCLFIPLSNTFAQTKLIAFKSHSGNLANFEVALENKLFDIGNSNFGVAPSRVIKYARLDSLIHLSDSTVLMVTSNICKNTYGQDSTLWSAGRDTLLHHPLFNQQLAKDSIKTVLDQAYHFVNKADSVTFIGYDPIKPKSKKKSKVLKKKKEKKQKKKKKKQELIKVQKDTPDPTIQTFSFSQQFLTIAGLAIFGMIVSFFSTIWRK